MIMLYVHDHCLMFFFTLNTGLILWLLCVKMLNKAHSGFQGNALRKGYRRCEWTTVQLITCVSDKALSLSSEDDEILCDFRQFRITERLSHHSPTSKESICRCLTEYCNKKLFYFITEMSTLVAQMDMQNEKQESAIRKKKKNLVLSMLHGRG